MMELLMINKQKVADILQVAIGYSEKEFNVFIDEAQNFDFKPIVNEKFYYELLSKKEDGDVWQKLLDGGPYTFEGSTYYTKGIAHVLAYFTYARFIRKSNNVSTSHGFVTKTNSHSTPLSLDEKNNMYYKYKADANIILTDIKTFIERNISDYPSWNSDTNCTTKNKRRFKTSVLQ
ncbi:hypothetical protein J2Q11_08705 [Tenacibaculum finnmarkense genomovar finnmarkense]|uniref:DUF6712 family protein n=2 Tax=Tenacibaculum finnmarkense TaxID=2781243 RepID=UPI001EFAB45E|nr:hypothetical protein [Tenacibaculum finnmarkense]MCG8212923.1 hypothetical protein [Tenacibaculum finnmarkense genomovar finnmarkense]MCG8231206.1 hypothetical protein [Tenacibaculum finnmarkense genomovar finnmarkense]MCG8884579.1 hypothetical protein [Tenacibaculum finnmarkense]MCG8897159.1 hypothetical protein [Tenacibaculum finnmarkense]MCG8903234.1 hypothetical protein [Tenacibaculum finnmarkense]